MQVPLLQPPPRHGASEFIKKVLFLGVVLVAFIILVPSNHERRVIVTDVIPTLCESVGADSEPYGVMLNIDGTDFMLLLDTGSSNLVIASDACETCHVSPRIDAKGTLKFNISYGSGSITNQLGQGNIKFGSKHIKADIGYIIEQETHEGFNLFANSSTCYNTYAGILGLAYKGQAAGPFSNGSTTPFLDRVIERYQMSNYFAIEICPEYPENCPTRSDNASWNPTSKCASDKVGALFIGGYTSSRVDTPIQYALQTDQVHFNVQIVEIEVCGELLCENVTFPDAINGTTEDSCVCDSPDCSKLVHYCYFSVLDTGTQRIYLNTVANTEALLNTMQRLEMVNSNDKSFYYNKTALQDGVVYENSSLSFYMTAYGDGLIKLPVENRYLFRKTKTGLVQNGIQGDLALIRDFSKAKFPILLGNVFMRGKAILYDRSRKRIGFGSISQASCQKKSSNHFDLFGANSDPTPGDGCRRGTGSGGGC